MNNLRFINVLSAGEIMHLASRVQARARYRTYIHGAEREFQLDGPVSVSGTYLRNCIQ